MTKDIILTPKFLSINEEIHKLEYELKVIVDRCVKKPMLWDDFNIQKQINGIMEQIKRLMRELKKESPPELQGIMK